MINFLIELGLFRDIGLKVNFVVRNLWFRFKKIFYVEFNMKNNFKVKWFLDKVFKIEKCDVINILIVSWYLMGR